jgi:hypothetical protein
MLKKSASCVLASFSDFRGLAPALPAIKQGQSPVGRATVPVARCGLARGKARLGALGWVGENSGHFEHPAKCFTVV